jgi:hypothetical protein
MDGGECMCALLSLPFLPLLCPPYLPKRERERVCGERVNIPPPPPPTIPSQENTTTADNSIPHHQY